MSPADAVRRVLMDARGQALCDSCLASVCSTNVGEMRKVIEEILRSKTFVRHEMCVTCRRTVPSTMYVAKCAHCSARVMPRDNSLLFGGELFHAACLRVLVSAKAIRESCHLNAQSRRLLEDARRQIRARRPSKTVAELVKEKFDAGTLPVDHPVRLWAGKGSGRTCAACGQPIQTSEQEYEPQYDDGRPILLFHSECHALWEAERHRRRLRAV